MEGLTYQQQALWKPAAPPVADDGEAEPRLARVRDAVEQARRYLLSEQHDDGHWCAELEGDTILESEYVLCLYFFGRSGEERIEKATGYLRRQQGEDGGWANYPGGPADVSASVKAYVVLKLAGDDPESPHMTRARDRILALGGVDACNSFTKIYLAIFGLYEWSRCPAVPPEMILLPRWFYFNIYAMSAWTRTIVVPLAIIWATKPSCPLPVRARIPELRLSGRPPAAPSGTTGLKARLWGGVFRLVNAANRGLEALGLRPFRRRALAACEAWILPRLERSDGLGAIFPPILNTLIALKSLGYPIDHPVIRSQMRELEALEIEEGDTLRLQPCKSPVWDTALALDALLATGLEAGHPALERAARWLLAREVRRPGDRQVIDPSTPVGGWYFEYANEFYPDCDDTAEVLKSLSRLRLHDPRHDLERREAVARGIAWMRAMQNRDGGWGAFDRGCDKEILTYIPFADHNAMIDPSTSDVTARAIEAFRGTGVDAGAPELRRAAEFLRRQQEADGSWYGRWGCNYLYGTWLALQGLRAAGEAPNGDRCARAAVWIRGCQNADGGWGELPLSYDDPGRKGEGPSTAAQTAWALLGLFAAGDFASAAVRRGVDHLLRRQREDGSWHDEHWTGTGFPRVFYLRYHGYAIYFPLHALAVYEARRAGGTGERRAAGPRAVP